MPCGSVDAVAPIAWPLTKDTAILTSAGGCDAMALTRSSRNARTRSLNIVDVRYNSTRRHIGVAVSSNVVLAG